MNYRETMEREGNYRHPIPPRLILDDSIIRVLYHLYGGGGEAALPAGDGKGAGDDGFMMYEFKVRRCPIGRSHDWTECPYAHPGEKARRRHPARSRYGAAPCPEFRKGRCERGDACDLAHGIFESWLHPERYRTEVCKDGLNCRRRVCFFAHTPEELRVLVSPRDPVLSSPTSTLISPYGSPPVSPIRRGSVPIGEVVAALRNLEIRAGGPTLGRVVGGGFVHTPPPLAVVEDCGGDEGDALEDEPAWVTELVK